MFHRICLLTCTLLLAACGAPSRAVAPRSHPTPTRQPDVDLEALLIQPGDLPAGYAGAHIRNRAPQAVGDLPSADAVAFQEIVYDDAQAGGVAVWLYSNHDDHDRAYMLLTADMEHAAPLFATVGERRNSDDDAQPRSAARSGQLGSLQVVFSRCNALARVEFIYDDPQTPEAIAAYTERLDDRLQERACL